MKHYLLIILASILFASCQLDNHEAEEQYSGNVTGKITFKGGEWTVKESPMSRWGNYQEVYGFWIREITDTDTLHYATGITRNLAELELEFRSNRDYIIRMSYVRLEEDLDLSMSTKIFGQALPSDDYISYDRDPTAFPVHPFITHIVHGEPRRSGSKFYVSEKFVGENTIAVGEDDLSVEMEMYRLSGILGFRILNLNHGHLEIQFDDPGGYRSRNPHFTQTFTAEATEQHKFRPAIGIREPFEGDLIQIIKGISPPSPPSAPRPFRPRGGGSRLNSETLQTTFPVTVVYIEDPEDISSSRELFEDKVTIYRNESITYELDLNDFVSEDAGSRSKPGWKRVIEDN